MQGKRVDRRETWEHGNGPKPGDYWKSGEAVGGVCPNGMFCDLSKHNVVEHEDGTLTVTPSILCGDAATNWHGFLERGIWREA
jgi:hypothetical protein